MRIAIDARMIRHNSMHGIARYVYGLIEELSRVEKEFTFYILAHHNSPLDFIQFPKHMKLTHVESKLLGLREQWEIPKLIKNLHIDLFHAPSFVVPFNCPSPIVMTIHDLNHLVLAQYYTLYHKLYYKFFVARAMKKAKIILTVSEFSKSEIIKHMGIAPQKIVVTYNGISSHYKAEHQQKDLDYIRELYQLPKKYILSVCNCKPHKNLKQLVQAYCLTDVKIPLVLATGYDPKLQEIAANYKKKHLIIFSRFINEKHLPLIYAQASLFVYPSSYEGFGLPPLEAMACGVPVLASKSSSLPEILGSFVTYTEPNNIKALAHDISMILEDKKTPSLQKKTQQINHAKQFTWRNLAEKTLAVYKTSL